jgi:calcium-dependent protein kinase
MLIGLLQGVAYMHAQAVMHRDLKLENIMVRRDSRRNGRVMPVIIDLGLAEYVTAEKYLYVRCGTPGYVAPEVLVIKSADPVQTYSEACDMFSLGVILHIL